jgi:signal transduction histidine kinase/tetratricopeptide (TPR) repeat protein
MRLILTYCTLFLCVVLSAQELDIIKTDSLQKVVSESSGNKKAKALYELSVLQMSKNDSLALHFINEAINNIDDDDKLKGKALFQRAMVFRSDGNDILAIRDLKEASLTLKERDTLVTVDALYWLMRIHRSKGLFPEALNYGFRELELRKILKDSFQIASSMFDVGYTYDRMGEYHQAIDWHKKALNYYSFNDNKPTQAWGIGLIGIAFDELKQYDSALYYNKLAVEGFKETGLKSYLKTWYSNIGNTYTKMNDLDNAELYTKKSLGIDVPNEDESLSLINLGKIYIEKGQYKDAQKTLDSAMSLVKKYDQKRFLSEAFYRFHELRKKQRRFADALEYYKKYKINEDELLNETKLKQIIELGIQYETNEKEKQILIQRAELAELDFIIQKRNYQIYGVLALALILGLIGYLFYNQQRLKNNQLKKEIELKEALLKIEAQNRLQDQRLRISRDLHDNIGAQLTFVISSLDNLKYGFKIDNEKLAKKLESISGFTAETIYELRDTIWAMNKNEITFEDLRTRITNFIEKANLTATNTTFKFICEDNINKEKTFTSVEGMNIYRIIQEAVNNALKYAEATKINVNITKEDSKINIQILDNGKGFNENEIEFGNGINNMKKRAQDIGAELVINSVKSKGTSVVLNLKN